MNDSKIVILKNSDRQSCNTLSVSVGLMTVVNSFHCGDWCIKRVKFSQIYLLNVAFLLHFFTILLIGKSPNQHFIEINLNVPKKNITLGAWGFMCRYSTKQLNT
jgi:hypothetical protein